MSFSSSVCVTGGETKLACYRTSSGLDFTDYETPTPTFDCLNYRTYKYGVSFSQSASE